MPYLFIVNPSSGVGRSEAVAREVPQICRSHGADFDIRRTSGPGDARRIASEGVGEGFTRIVSVGGDGTSSEIACAIVGTDVKLGIIPCGSGNDFPSACGIPKCPSDALETVFGDVCMRVDVGSLGGRVFINGLGIGMDGAIAAAFPRFRFLGGFAGYLAAATAQAVAFKGFPVLIQSAPVGLEGDCLLAGVSNGPSQGGFKISPAARPDDGLLELHFVRNMSPPLRVLRLVSIMAGSAGGDWINRFQTASATIETSYDLPAHMDGEPFVLPAGRHEVSIRKGALAVLSPAGAP